MSLIKVRYERMKKMKGLFTNSNFAGELGRSKKVVAMKISPTLNINDPRLSPEEQLPFRKAHIVNEYRMYSYLKAINNSKSEAYGIPTVYYYGEWEDCNLLALTLLDSEFMYDSSINSKDIDVFITLREYVSRTFLCESNH